MTLKQRMLGWIAVHTMHVLHWLLINDGPQDMNDINELIALQLKIRKVLLKNGLLLV